MTNLAIIGSGNIGRTLGEKWHAAGHAVSFGVRAPQDEKYQPLRRIGAVASIVDSLAEAEVVVLALPGAAVADLAAQHAEVLAGKVVIDATNNVREAAMHSLGLLSTHIPSVQLFRAFSTLGWENFANPQLAGEPIDLFFCGAAGSAQIMLSQLISDVGLRPVYVGGVDKAALLDNLTRLWFALAFEQKHGRRFAFKMVTE